MDTTKLRPSDARDSDRFTTNAGAPVYDNTSSLSVGSRGPVLLEDYHLLEKLAHFDRERIQERVVHARGVVAKGFFEVTHDISDLSFASLFSEVGKKTPVAARFSAVVHSKHSPEGLRDPRGFAVKFYTDDGIWDLVGNNFPVFFIRDGIKFPDMVHAFKPNPRTENQEWWRILDFFANHPESIHTFVFLLDDTGIPKSYRHMRGSGVHTYRLINSEGKETYVKFHWVPTCGEENLFDEDAERIQGKDFSFGTHDLINSIDEGNFPEWQFLIQTMDPATENDYEFDPLDATKTWPEDRFPRRPVGRMVLDKNVDNQFLENEQIAFSPAVIVPGIDYSADKLLQVRLFAYSDTQRYRLGANYLQLPINEPRNPHHDSNYDGPMNTMFRSSEINYYPSTLNNVHVAEKYPISTTGVEGVPMKKMIEKENNFQQAGELYRTFDEARQERFIKRVVERLTSPRVTKELKATWLKYWGACDKDLGERLTKLVPVEDS